jgi:hypothetical protein
MVFSMLGGVRSSSGQSPTNVTVIQLIATPERYDGKLIRVIGFLSLEFEGNALYLHQEDYEQVIFRDAIWVEVTPEMDRQKEVLDKHYVLLEGTFSATEYGHMGGFSGTIKNVTRAAPHPSRVQVEKMISH